MRVPFSPMKSLIMYKKGAGDPDRRTADMCAVCENEAQLKTSPIWRSDSGFQVPVRQSVLMRRTFPRLDCVNNVGSARLDVLWQGAQTQHNARQVQSNTSHVCRRTKKYCVHVPSKLCFTNAIGSSSSPAPIVLTPGLKLVMGSTMTSPTFLGLFMPVKCSQVMLPLLVLMSK